MCGGDESQRTSAAISGAEGEAGAAHALKQRQENVLERLDEAEAKLQSLGSSFGNRLAQLQARQIEILKRLEELFAQVKQYGGCFKEEGDQEPELGSTGSAAQEACCSSSSERETEGRLRSVCLNLGCSSAVFKRVPADYYDRSLEERRDMLGAHSVEHLCKSIVMVNTQAAADVVDCRDPNNSKYYVIIVQYAARLHADKVRNFIYGLNEGRIPKKRFNMRLAPEEISDELTGYSHNGVTPFGMRTQIPIILSHKIAQLDPPFFWLGAGEVDQKLGMKCSEFISALNPFVVDCTY